MEIELIIGITIAVSIGAFTLIRFKSKNKNTTKTIQKDNTVSGDQAGRDINK